MGHGPIFPVSRKRVVPTGRFTFYWALSVMFNKPKKIMLAVVSLILLFTGFAGCVQEDVTYSNPVLEESFRVRTESFNTTIGIGDPAVIFHDGMYYLYPTGDNYSYTV